ncbi:4-(cytidine 5'-diphospho)-2-C-methyl-D-erythritol kinase [Rhodovarius lipocyclicus]|uniref:4-(cytidine 5'-diphospho)-2-C-methyl-D-erythritol kinase n=1 Tax=Rhodovarius lipocyclicus TaxID=268410 RepID=UPI00135C1F3B|nr:4-(cytidine 5'-diphospho)-2-C-methyl-D-erythritol kinase [Rhodovarius lipocyclicus]
MIEAAPAKVNLYLHVIGRRADGYHVLDSLAVFGPAADEVRLSPARRLALELQGPFAEGLLAEADNLVLRAARALAKQAGIAPEGTLTLVKNLPVASGIGGGSADAAATLRLLNRAWGLGLPESALLELALPLGADVPVCVASRPTRMGGVGEVMGTAPRTPPAHLLLVNPRIPLSTPDVFRARQGGFTPMAALPAAWADARAMAETLRGTRNDLEEAAISLVPQVAEVLSAIGAQPGCLLARMSGSGATCFGLFARAEAALAAAAAMPHAWWSAAGPLYEPAA